MSRHAEVLAVHVGRKCQSLMQYKRGDSLTRGQAQQHPEVKATSLLTKARCWQGTSDNNERLYGGTHFAIMDAGSKAEFVISATLSCSWYAFSAEMTGEYDDSMKWMRG